MVYLRARSAFLEMSCKPYANIVYVVHSGTRWYTVVHSGARLVTSQPLTGGEGDGEEEIRDERDPDRA